MPSVQIDKATLARLVAQGLITLPGNHGKKKRKAELVAASFLPPGTWTAPVVTASEVNRRDWRSRSRRTQDARRVLSAAFGPTLRFLADFAEAYHAGKRLRVVFTRLGGAKVDPSNLPTTTKGCEDYLCLVIGADDGDERWNAMWRQEPGGAVGVRIELSVIG